MDSDHEEEVNDNSILYYCYKCNREFYHDGRTNVCIFCFDGFITVMTDANLDSEEEEYLFSDDEEPGGQHDDQPPDGNDMHSEENYTVLSDEMPAYLRAGRVLYDPIDASSMYNRYNTRNNSNSNIANSNPNNDNNNDNNNNNDNSSTQYSNDEAVVHDILSTEGRNVEDSASAQIQESSRVSTNSPSRQNNYNYQNSYFYQVTRNAQQQVNRIRHLFQMEGMQGRLQNTRFSSRPTNRSRQAGGGVPSRRGNRGEHGGRRIDSANIGDVVQRIINAFQNNTERGGGRVNFDVNDLQTPLFENLIAEMLTSVHSGSHIPASDESIRNLETTQLDELLLERNDKCSICMDKFELNLQVKKMPCDHVFHQSCIESWLNLNNSCPICRKEL